uniref:RXYLT1 C-terminal domain-containing protein n=1 Tax=viral metagenome TaxID=1070528 RepID=A0A6C0DL59_9ZZZZ
MSMTLRAWQQTYKDPKTFIVQASKQDGSDGWLTFPIGMGWQFAANYRGQKFWQIGSHQKTVLCAISSTSDFRRRPSGINRGIIIYNLNKHGIKNINLSGAQYFNELPSYKFIISPEGNGIDCHRHYEALMAGCIPIIEDNPLVREKYRGCPILYTKDYSEINETYLQERYKEMLDQTFDFSRLFLSSYILEDQIGIKNNGNYWVKMFCYKNWY